MCLLQDAPVASDVLAKISGKGKKGGKKSGSDDKAKKQILFDISGRVLPGESSRQHACDLDFLVLEAVGALVVCLACVCWWSEEGRSLQQELRRLHSRCGPECCFLCPCIWYRRNQGTQPRQL